MSWLPSAGGAVAASGSRVLDGLAAVLDPSVGGSPAAGGGSRLDVPRAAAGTAADRGPFLRAASHLVEHRDPIRVGAQLVVVARLDVDELAGVEDQLFPLIDAPDRELAL